MKGIAIYNYIRKQSKTNPKTYPDDQLVADFNMNKDYVCEEIAKRNEDIFGMLAYRNLVAGQREYSLPEEMLNNMKYFEVDLEGNGKYIHSDEFDLVNYERGTSEDQIKKDFQFCRPGYMLFRESIWLFTAKAIKSVFDGLKLWYIRYPDDVTLELLKSNTEISNNLIHPKSSGIMRQFHQIIADLTVITYKNSKEKPIPLTAGEKAVAGNLLLKLDAISGVNLDRNQTAKVPRHNDGYDY